jgi:hypothetical protein
LRDVVPLLPTPTASDSHGHTNRGGTRSNEVFLPGAVRDLLPTPTAGNFNDGESLESWEARRARNKAKGINGNGQGTPLAITAQQLSGAPTNRPSAAGSTSPAGLPLGQLSLDDLAND